MNINTSYGYNLKIDAAISNYSKNEKLKSTKNQ